MYHKIFLVTSKQNLWYSIHILTIRLVTFFYRMRGPSPCLNDCVIPSTNSGTYEKTFCNAPKVHFFEATIIMFTIYSNTYHAFSNT